MQRFRFIAGSACVLLLSAQQAFSQGYEMTTVAGGGLPATPSPAVAASFQFPKAVAADTAGNAYFIANNSVFKVDSSGTLTRAAGISPQFGYSGDGGNATSAQLNHPSGLAVDAAGDLFISDSGNNVIRKVAADGTITTLAGTGVAGFSGDGGTATSAQLNSPGGLGVDASGNVYFADTNNQRIRKIGTDGTISTVAGNGGTGYSGDGGQATSATFSTPTAVALDSAGNLYVADAYNYRVRKISRGGTITTIAGVGSPGYAGDGGPATSAKLFQPYALALDGSGSLYIADEFNNRVRQVSPSGIISTFAGNGVAGFSGDMGAATSAELSVPQGVAVDGSGNLFIADEVNNRIRKVSGGTITTVAGSGASGDSGDQGPATSAQLTPNYGVAVDANGNLYVSDYYNHVIRKVTPAGIISTVAGTGTAGFSGDTGPATSAQLHSPAGLAIDTNNNLYVADEGNQRIRKIATNGTITTVAGNGQYGYSGDNGPATSGEMRNPFGVAVDSAGNLYIADTFNNVIREVSGGTITTIAGNGTAGFGGDGNAATGAELNNPFGVAVDSSGNILIADSLNGRLRKVGTDGNISTLTTTVIFYGVTADASGNAYIANTGIDLIEKVTSSGTVSTIAGVIGQPGYSGDNGPATSANVNQPQAITADAAGRIYFADSGNFAVRELVPAATSAVLAISKTHSGEFPSPSMGANYTVVVSNAAGAGSTTGTVMVTDTLPSGFSLTGMSGNGWSCSGSTCTRNDALNGGASYPAITVSVTVPSNAAPQVTNQVALSGGGSSGTSANDVTNTVLNASPAAPTLNSPANGATGVSPNPTLTWNSAAGALSYDVHFGTNSTPPLVLNTTETSYSPGTLAVNTTYYWQVIAKNGSGSANSPIWSFTTTSSCSFAINPINATAVMNAGAGSVDVMAGGGCSWTATSNVAWLSITSGASGSGNGSVTYSVAANPYTLPRTGTMTIAGQTFTLTQNGNATLLFIPVAPCRVADTRTGTGPFGGPILSANSTREFDVPNSSCNIPSSAAAYSVNVTAVPSGTLNFLTLYPAGQPKPGVSTLNSDGRVKANAAIALAGSNGGINVFVTDQTHVILDINGYFVPSTNSSALAFYPLTPCRVVDTRQATGPLGGPSLGAATSRSFPVLSSSCSVPSTAQAYSVNFTAIPHGFLNYLTTWPTGQNQPPVSTLNSSTGTVTANAAIVPAGTNGSVSVFASDATDVLMDINGYFAPPQSSGLSLYTVAPCRALDSRSPAGSQPLNGMRTVDIAGSGCGAPSSAHAFLLNATVVPSGSLGWLTLWPDGQSQPNASTLNAYDGAITSNMAIVPSTNGVIDAFSKNPTYVLLDLSGYFAP